MIILLGLFLLGLCLGSFANALIWRLHIQSKAKSKKYSISKGRSMCPSCKHDLSAKDLVPVLSWLSLRGKCRYCHKPISGQYPLVELTTGVLFVSSYIFWPTELDTASQTLNFTVWLVSLVGLVALFVFDLRYTLLPNRIVFPLILLSIGTVLISSIIENSSQPIIGACLGALVGGGVFHILFELSGGKWIGGGDVKLGYLLGLLLGSAGLSFLMLFTASLLGTIFVLPQIIKGNYHPKTKIPFGPFLIIASILAKFFGQTIIDAYTSSLL